MAVTRASLIAETGTTTQITAPWPGAALTWAGMTWAGTGRSTPRLDLPVPLGTVSMMGRHQANMGASMRAAMGVMAAMLGMSRCSVVASGCRWR